MGAPWEAACRAEGLSPGFSEWMGKQARGRPWELVLRPHETGVVGLGRRPSRAHPAWGTGQLVQTTPPRPQLQPGMAGLAHVSAVGVEGAWISRGAWPQGDPTPRGGGLSVRAVTS